MKQYRIKKISHSVKIVSACLLSLFLFGSFGCAQDKPIVFDYASQPEEFVVRLEPNQKYTIVRGKNTFPFSLTLKNDMVMDNGTAHLIWNRIDRKERMLRAKERVPYLIHVDGKDFLYIYGDRNGDLEFIELSDTDSVRGADNARLHFYEEPKDPKNLPVRIGIPVLGSATAELRYHVGKLGKPVPNDPEGYRYCTEADRKDKFVTMKPCRVLVFASKEAAEGKEETLPAGSVFTRLRCKLKTDDTDLLLEDGRVFRVRELYLFSEPHSIMEIRDLADKRFEYKKLDAK